jgi:hypothetical protein
MQMPSTQSQYFALMGGLDVESAQLSRRPGLLMAGSNYESATENGYERLGGFEAFDGRPRPSDGTFLILQASTVFTGVVVGNTVTGVTSGCTAKVIQVRKANQLVVTRVSGTFTQGETLNVAGSPVGVYATLGDDIDSFGDNVLQALAEADYRADIQAVPGSGPIRGIEVLAGVTYAWRNNAGATALDIYKSTAGGWVKITLYKELAFTAGSVAPTEGSTVTKGAVTATVKRVVLESGAWSGGTAAGRLIVDNVAGGSFTAGAFTAGITATCSGAESQITLLPNGRVDSVVYNFTGSTATERIYGADGINRGFEFDGDVLVPIKTGMAADAPVHCWCHRNHLFFSFKGSAQHSAIGAPYSWSVVLGAAELACGQDIVGFDSLPGDADTSALLIFTANRVLVLYGSSSSDWKLTTFSARLGAQRWSVQNIGNPVAMDFQGVVAVTQSTQFGNFSRAPVSDRIRRYLSGRIVTASVVNRAKNRMRVFFADGEGLSISAVGKGLAFTPINYGKTVRVAREALINGVHRTFFGSDDGFVYEADRGRSFNGTKIIAWGKQAFNFEKSPGVKKRFRRSEIEVKPQSAMTLQVQAEYSLGDVDIALTDVYTKLLRGQGGVYDVTNWDQCYYDTAAQQQVSVRHDGVGTSISLTFYSESDNELPHVLQSVTNYFTPRRQERG